MLWFSGLCLVRTNYNNYRIPGERPKASFPDIIGYMKIFVAASYSSKVNYDTGEVFPEYKEWLEDILDILEKQGNEVFCALRADQYKINDTDPAEAFSLDMHHIQESDAILALLSDEVSAGVQTEIGAAISLKKRVILAHEPKDELAWFNAAMIKAGTAKELILPLNEDELENTLAITDDFSSKSAFAETVKAMANTAPISNEELKQRKG